jgi:hypothetical protein
MAALVLSLLIASAKSTYDTRSNQLLQISADIILLDRVLARYGPETKDARNAWPPRSSGFGLLTPAGA